MRNSVTFTAFHLMNPTSARIIVSVRVLYFFRTFVLNLCFASKDSLTKKYKIEFSALYITRHDDRVAWRKIAKEKNVKINAYYIK